VKAKLIVAVVGSLLPAAGAVTDAWGQVALPGTAQPGQIERQFEKPPEPTARPKEITIPAARREPPPEAETIRFVLNQLTVENVTMYSAGALQSIYADLLGKEVTLGGIYRIADALTARYRNDGYILSQVIVPAQTVERGALRLQAVEGYIAQVRVEGGSAAMNARVRKYAEKIRRVHPLTAGALERYVLLVNDIPGVQARAVLMPATTPGASDLLLQLSQDNYAAAFSSDTRGSKAQGRQRVFGDVDMSSLLGASSLTQLLGVTTLDPELFYILLGHEQLLGTEGGMIAIAGSYAYSRPQELALIPLELMTKSRTMTLTYTHPLVRSRTRNLYLRGTLSAFDSTSTVFGVKDTADSIRALRLGLTYDASDGLRGVNIVDLEFSQGISELGASRNGDLFLSRPGGRSDFRRTALYAARLQSLPRQWSVAAAINAQYALTDLLAPELFSVGGEQFGRGYDFAEILNDHGVAAKLDLRYSHTWSGKSTASLMPYAFFDFGQVWQRRRVLGLDLGKQSITSSGVGIRLGVGRHLWSFVEFAKPLSAVVGQTKNRNGRVYAGLSTQ